MNIISHDGFHFTNDGIKKIEALKNAKYMGFWCTKRSDGSWNEIPVDVFYVENPDREKGYSNYFGMFSRYGKVYITNAESAFSEPIEGLLHSDGTILVSRYRHDYRTYKDMMVDGGRDYFRHSPGTSSKYITITVKEGKFHVSSNEEIEIDPEKRDWEYSGEGVKIKKNTQETVQ